MQNLQDRTVRWEAWSRDGLEHFCLSRDADKIRAAGVVIGARGGVEYGLTYALVIDDLWRVREVQAQVVNGARLNAFSDGEGHWYDAEKNEIVALEGCIDIDIAATPFTNTLPIRRLNLIQGQSADIQVVYVPLPDLALRRVDQRYTKVTQNSYLYEGMFRQFSAELQIDDDGLVIDYPETFRRLPA